MKILNISDGKKVKLPLLRLPKISIFEEGADKKVAMYRAIILLLAFAILFLLGQAYGDDIKSGKVFGREKVQEDVQGVSNTTVPEQNAVTISNPEAKTQTTESEIVYDRTDFEKFEAIYKFTQEYRGSRIDTKYYTLLKNACGEDPEILRSVIAISVSESGMGRDLSNRQSNFWGWFKGGNRDYDPSREQMAVDICNGIRKNYGEIKDSWTKIVKYTGNSSPKTWYANYMWAYNQMEVK